MKLLGVIGLSMLSFAVMAQTSTVDSVMQHVSGHKLSVGGYGEVAYSRNYYSDHYYRYSNPSKYKDKSSHACSVFTITQRSCVDNHGFICTNITHFHLQYYGIDTSCVQQKV